MADITTTTTLQEHRERIGRLLVSDLDFGFGQTAWWKGTFLEDEAYPAIEDMCVASLIHTQRRRHYSGCYTLSYHAISSRLY